MIEDQIFLGQNGIKMQNGVPDFLSQHFDCQVTSSKIYLKKENPKFFYTKTDFLPLFVNHVLPNIKNEFVLITGCSDYSPEINFNREYNILTNHENFQFWFMNNMKTKTPKTFSLPAGLAAGQFWNGCTESEVDTLLLQLRAETKKEEKKDKVFCCFRTKDRNWNDCGHSMIIRPRIMEIIKERTDIFDFYEEDSMNFKDFVQTISKYKHSLCPHGNGMDPNPNAWLSLIVQTTPVVYKIDNTVSMFEDTSSVIFFENFEELLEKSLYVDKPEINLEFLTNKFWANKIKNKKI